MPYSNYSKIRDLLSEMAKEDSPKELFQLAEEIHQKKIESFAIWRPAPEAGSLATKTYCSTKAIRRLIRFISELGFIDIGEGRQCSMTSYGRNALKDGNYSRMLATHVAMYLKENAGVTYTEIRDTIASIRRPEVPFFETIFGRLESEKDLSITESRLRTVLYLLERSGTLTTMTKKVYFADESGSHTP